MRAIEIANKYNISKAAVILQINKGRLKALKEKNRWIIDEDDYNEFRKTRYRRSPHLFDKSKGIYSVKDLAELAGCDKQKIYYHIRKGYIKYTRSNLAYLFNIRELGPYVAALDAHKNKTMYVKKIFKQEIAC